MSSAIQDRAAMFKSAQAIHQAQKKKEEARREGKGSFEPIEYSGLRLNEWQVFRLLGEPVELRSEATSPKVVLVSSIVGDNGKKLRVVWPSQQERPDWILWKIFSKVISYKWNSVTKQRTYQYADSHPMLVKRVLANGTDNAFDKGWKPTSFVVMNVLDREKAEWHKQSMHTVLLSKKGSPSKDGETMFYEAGVPTMLWDLIFDEVVAMAGDFELYDIAIKKLDDKPFYKVADLRDPSVAEEVSEQAKAMAVVGPLTEEERFYAKYDFDKLFKVTTYKKINERLKVFIQQVDAELGTKFYPELLKLAEEEETSRPQTQESEAEVEEEASLPSQVATPAQAPAASVTVKTTVAPAPAVARKVSSPVTFDVNKLDPNLYKGLSVMSDKEKALIVGVNPDGSLVYSKEAGQLLECPSMVIEGGQTKQCSFKVPEKLDHCPRCGVTYES